MNAAELYRRRQLRRLAVQDGACRSMAPERNFEPVVLSTSEARSLGISEMVQGRVTAQSNSVIRGYPAYMQRMEARQAVSPAVEFVEKVVRSDDVCRPSINISSIVPLIRSVGERVHIRDPVRDPVAIAMSRPPTIALSLAVVYHPMTESRRTVTTPSVRQA